MTTKCECGHSIHIHGERQSEVVRPCLAIEPGQPSPKPTGVPCGCEMFRPTKAARVRS